METKPKFCKIVECAIKHIKNCKSKNILVDNMTIKRVFEKKTK